jgi:HSP20 family protein
MNITLYRNPARTLTDWSPFYRPLGLLEGIDELARDLWASWQPGLLGTTLAPHIDMYEEKGQLVVQMELPGITEKDLEVTLEDDVLTIKAEKKEEVTEDANHHTGERYYGKYIRSMSLPTHVNGDKITATLDNGVLELRIPKAEKVKAKRIEIKAQLPQGECKQRQRKSKQKSS